MLGVLESFRVEFQTRGATKGSIKVPVLRIHIRVFRRFLIGLPQGFSIGHHEGLQKAYHKGFAQATIRVLRRVAIRVFDR